VGADPTDGNVGCQEADVVALPRKVGCLTSLLAIVLAATARLGTARRSGANTIKGPEGIGARRQSLRPCE
jgi:hypothetical protein